MNPALSLRPPQAVKIPLFLAPAFASNAFPLSAARCFSSTTCRYARRRGRRDMNRDRGVSAIRSTGTRRPLSVDRLYEELPVPRPESERPLEDFPINPDHGLYGFFNKEQQVVINDEAEGVHGRSWKYKELMNKSFEELHQLYWACILEGNRIATRYGEHKRMKLAYGQVENRTRADVVQRTMKNIRDVLRDRQSAYEEAQVLLNQKTIRELLEKKESVFELEDVVVQQSAITEAPAPPPEIKSTPSSPAGPSQSRKQVLGPRPTD